MQLTFNFRSGISPLTLTLEGDTEKTLTAVKKAMREGEILDLTDAEGERAVIPTDAISYVMVPSRSPSPVGFGRM